MARIRITVDVSDRRKRAFFLYAAAKGLNANEAFGSLVDTQLGKWLALADAEIDAEAGNHAPAKKNPKPKA